MPPARPPLNGTVLLVDDETRVLGFMCELLENWGLRVLAVSDPTDALRQVRDARLHFDILLADQTMPRLTGTELARRVFALRPGIPILIYTGYRDAVAPEALADSCVRAVLDKPVDPMALRQLLCEHLSSGEAGSGTGPIGRPGTSANEERQRSRA